MEVPTAPNQSMRWRPNFKGWDTGCSAIRLDKCGEGETPDRAASHSVYSWVALSCGFFWRIFDIRASICGIILTLSEFTCRNQNRCHYFDMPTDGADFKRRVKYHGQTYTEIKNGSDVATVALYGTAGLAREILGDNPIPAFHAMVLTTVECLEGVLSGDRGFLLRELRNRLTMITDPHPSSAAQTMAAEALIREAGRISSQPIRHRESDLVERLVSATGRDLHDGLVIGLAEDYAMHHRKLSHDGLEDFKESWRDAAQPRLTEMMHSLFESGKIDRQFTRPRPELAPVRADSLDDLHTPLVP